MNPKSLLPLVDVLFPPEEREAVRARLNADGTSYWRSKKYHEYREKYRRLPKYREYQRKYQKEYRRKKGSMK
jgi:anti-sigma factor RsiW